MTSTHGRTPMYGSQTPMYGTGSRTPMYGSQTPLHDGETHTPTKGVPLWTSVRLYTHDRSRACSHCGDSCSPQGAVLLTTARRRRCMMGAGRQGRAERGIPTTPTHRPGRLHVGKKLNVGKCLSILWLIRVSLPGQELSKLIQLFFCTFYRS